MKAIIPAAGYATRLYPLTENVPKALLKVGDRPMLEHVMGKLEAVDEIDGIHVVTNNKFYQAFLDWHAGYVSRKPVVIHNDGTDSNEDRLGTMGDVHFVLEKAGIHEDVMIVNADNLFDFPLSKLIDMYKERKGPVFAAYDVKDLELAKKFGVLQADGSSKVIDFEEKPAEPKSTLVSTGVYIFTADCMQVLRDLVEENPDDKSLCDKSGHFIQHLMLHKPVYVYAFSEMWYDIGGIEELRAAHKLFGGGDEYD